MIRVLHLLGKSLDFQNGRAAQTLHARLGAEFSIMRRIIGYDAGYRNPPLSAASVRHEQFDLLHLFGDARLLMAAVAVRKPILYSPSEFPDRRAAGWLRAMMDYRNVHVLCPTATMQRALVESGVPLSRCPLVRPGIDFSRINPQRDNTLRSALGFEESDHVLLAAGESTRAARHTDLVWATSMLHLLDSRQKVLLWGRGALSAKAERLGAALRQSQTLRVAEKVLGRPLEWEALLAAADAVVVTASAPVATLPIATAMASNRPIVSTVTYSVSELLEDRHTALLTPRRKPRQLAQRIADLRQDPNLAKTIADRARAEAYDFFPQTKFLKQMRELYQSLATDGDSTLPQS